MNVTAATLAGTSSSPITAQPKRAKRIIISLLGSAVLVAGGVTAAIADHSRGPSRAPGVAPAVQQDRLVKAERLQDKLDDGNTSGDDDVMAQIHALAGLSARAQQARTLLYQELRTR